MKKYFYLIICGVLLFSLFACSAHKQVAQSEDKVIDAGTYYRVYEKGAGQTNYVIYNKDGKTVLSETTDRPVIIQMLGTDVVDIGIGIGTGIMQHQYYNTKQNRFSKIFLSVLASTENLIAYLEIPESDALKDRKVIVQNIFDPDVYYKDFALEFSPVDTPVLEASFSEDKTSLQIVYLSGAKQTENSTILNLE